MAFNSEGLVFSDNYIPSMMAAVLPYIQQRRHDEVLPGYQGRALFTSRFDADEPRGTVMILHGFTENVEKYAELIHSLLTRQWSVVIYDQRGHGRSWRADGLADPSLTHVDRFDEYVRDMECVYRQITAAMPLPYRVFCHSMGGAVTALFLERHPGLFDRAAMCAPMIAPALKGLPKPVVQGMCRTALLFRHGKKRIIGSKPYEGKENFDTACANGRQRFDWYEQLRSRHPAFQNNGPSYGWLKEAMGVTKTILAPGAVEKIDAKVRLYSAELDQTVIHQPQLDFIRRVKDGSHVQVAGAKHEIYRSPDDILFPWWRDVLTFLED